MVPVVVSSLISLLLGGREAGLPPGAVATAEVDDGVDAERHRHLTGDGRALPDLAHEDGAVAELLGAGVGQDRGQDDVAGAGDEPVLLPLPWLADVDDL